MPKQKSTLDKQTDALSAQLLKGLTQAEIAKLLDALFQVLTPDLQVQAIGQLATDTQATIQQILHPTLQTTQPTSLAKLAQAWAETWQAWDDLIAVASEEEGKYIVQEARWEEPYFESYSFAEDLDAIAEQLQPLIPTAIKHQFTPNQGFIVALQEAESEIMSGIPEWMEIVDGISLGQHATTCLLMWEWQIAQPQHQDAFQLAQSIRTCETQFSSITLNDDAFFDFFTNLPEDAQKSLLAGLTAQKESSLWRSQLNNTNSPWHELYLYLIQQQAPERYLDQLRATIPQDWKNGLPVMQECLLHKDFAESLVVVQATLDSMLRSLHIDPSWQPEKTLLITEGYYQDYYKVNVSLLFEYYQQTALGLNQTELASALAIQCLAFERCFDWSAMLKIFRQNTVSAITQKALLDSWQDYIISICQPSRWGYGTSEHIKSSWVSGLLESVIDVQKGATWFQQTLSAWLKALPENPSKISEDYDLLRLLTKDLTKIQGQGKSFFPVFYEIVIRPGELSFPDDSSRQAYLQKYAAPDLLDQVMQYWKTHFKVLVPKPELAAKSNYNEHARALLALKEISPEDYDTLLMQWKVDHPRRKNLWQAIQSAELG